MKYFIIFLLIGVALKVKAFSLRKDNAHSDELDRRSRDSSHEKAHEKSFRKHFSDRSDERSDSNEENDSKPAKSLVIGLNTGETGKKSEGVDKLIQVVKDVVSKMNTEPLFRSKKFEFEESEKKRGKSSVGIELDTPTLLNFVKKVISSRKFKKATDEFARKAAVIFRALQDN